MGIYMKYDDIKGAVTTDGFKDWIELDSFQWGAERNIHSPTGGATTREQSEPTFNEVVVTKRTDVSSPKLFYESVGGVLNHRVTVKFTTTTKGKVETYLTFELEDTGVSGFSLSSHGEAPEESLT